MKTINDYVSEIKIASDKEWKALGYDMTKARNFSFTEGKRFAKILCANGYNGGVSVHCFVEIETGNIYKASGWSAPAKGVRGNINNERKPYLCGDFYR